MDSRSCPSCGAPVGEDHPHGLCPACLLKQGMASESTSRPVEGDPLRKALEAKLQGQYRLIRQLGHGGMGAVYLARDLTLDREVAIKVVKTASDERDLYDRFRREAKTAAKLSHPNIVPLHAFGEVEGLPYFVMGYVRGESLADRLRRDGKLSEEEAVRIFGEIADALDHAHRQGVIHRDIKPDNVLLEDESGRALLTDFGVAKAPGRGETLTRLGSVVGTPDYMSPEQASGRADLDGRSDIYSLGVMAYAMLAGRLPFEGNTPAEILTKHLTQEPAPLRSVAPAVSPSTAQAVERCLAKDPAARWPDARSLKLALGVSEESGLPDALRGVDGKGFTALAITFGLMLLSALMLGGPGEWDFWLVESCLVIIFVVAYLFVVTRLRRDGFSLSQSQIAIWREPAWWLWWYPRALRRRGNVWDRLPSAVRYLRGSIQAFVAYVIFGHVVIILFREDAGRIIGFLYTRGPTPAFLITMGIFSAIVLMWIVFSVRARRELTGKGLAPYDVNRVMMSVPPSRVSFWTRPHVAAMLAPARPETIRRPESPHDSLQSILRNAEELSGPLRPLGAQAAVAARQLVESIDQADRQIAELARNIEPGEQERLVEKIEALAPSAEGTDESAPLRNLLEKQLELIRDLSARIDETKERRNRRVETLRTLALHVASLHARLTASPSEVRQISDNVRALCDEIGAQAAALMEKASPTGAGRMRTFERT